MIKNWFFSSNGEVVGPFTLSDANLYLAKNPNVYGWHPSLIHWKPVSCIDEFSRVLPPVVQGSTLLKEISEQFITKQKRLENRLTTFSSSIENNELSIGDLDEEISEYKLLTQGLSLDVLDVINKIESECTNFKRQLSQIKETVNVANDEMLAVVESFDQRANSNDVAMPSTNHNAPQKKIESKKTTLDNTANKAKLAEEKLPEPNQSINQSIKVAPTEELEPSYGFSDLLKRYKTENVHKKENVQKKPESQQFYRGVPVETPDKVEGIKKKAVSQKMYRGVPILKD